MESVVTNPGPEPQAQNDITSTSRFQTWLNNLLRRRNLSGNAFSKRVGISQSAVQRWTSGQGLPNRETCERIADVLGVPLNEVLLQAGIIPREIRLGPSARHTHLHDLIDDLPDGMIDPLIVIIEAVIRETR